MPSVFIKTYGCQMNERDSEQVAAQLVAKGYTLAESEAQADVVLLNTCTVRDMAEQKALGKMQALAGQFRKTRPNVVLGFMGCMAQSRGTELISRLPDVDLVVGTQKFHRTAEYIDDLLAGRREQVVDVAPEEGSQSTIREHLVNGSGRRAVTGFVSIMQGCNQHCTFCIVPFTRGEERSRSISEIVEECGELAAQGVKEITLLGQIVTSYGRRLVPERGGKSPFVQLLEALHEVEGLERIRFTSPHPKGYGLDLVRAYGELPRLVESAHIPVQSGSNRILKLMHRGYTRERYLELISQLRTVQPHMGITTDLIVGFPGETEEDFIQTLDLIRQVGFDNAYIFKYSQRQNTPAADLSGQVPNELIEERHQRTLQLVNEIGGARYAALTGREVEILVEGPSKRNPARMMGRTRCNKIVVFDGNERHRGQTMRVRVMKSGSFTLYGDPAILNLD